MVYSIARYFNCSKHDVLKNVYIRELPLIISQMYEDRMISEREKLFDLLMTLNINAATAGMAPSAEAIGKISERLSNQLHDINSQFGYVEQNNDQLDEAGLMRLKAMLSQVGG